MKNLIIGISVICLTLFNIESKNQTTYKVGDKAHGGIVFWVDADGKHGKVCTGKDIATRSYVVIQDGSDESDFFFLYMNDPAIHDADGKQYLDWKLPTVKELKLMSTNLCQKGIGNFGSKGDLWYWSKDKDWYEDHMICVYMEDGSEDGESQTSEHAVRLVREF